MNTTSSFNGSLHQADPMDLLITSVFPSEPPAATRAALDSVLDRFRTSLDAHPYVRTLDKRRRIVRLTWRATMALAAAAAVVAAIMVFRSMHEPVTTQGVATAPSNPVMPHVSVPTPVIVMAANNEQWLVRGTVAYEDNTPVTGTLVWAEAEVPPLQDRKQAYACNPAAALSGAVTWTDANGSFALAIAEGVTSVVVKTMPKGCMSIATCSLPTTGQCVRLAAASKGGYFVGRFTGPDGIPVTNVTMWRLCENDKQPEADFFVQVPLHIESDGRYISSMVPCGHYTIQLIADGYAPQSTENGGYTPHDIPLTNNEQRVWNIHFDDGIVINGVVYNGSAEEPMEGVSIEVSKRDGLDFTGYTTWSARTDKDGRFRIAGGPYDISLTFSYPGCVSQTWSWRFDGEQSGEDLAPVIYLSPGADVFVRVLDAYGAVSTNTRYLCMKGINGSEWFQAQCTVSNGIGWFYNVPVHCMPASLELRDEHYRMICCNDLLSLIPGTVNEMVMRCPQNKIVVRFQPPITNMSLTCSGYLGHSAFADASMTQTEDNQWEIETLWTGHIWRIRANTVTGDSVAWTNDLVVGWDETKFVEFPLIPPATEPTQSETYSTMSTSSEKNEGANYHVRCRIADSRGNDMRAALTLMGLGGARLNTGVSTKGDVDFYGEDCVKNGSYCLYFYPRMQMEGFLVTSIFFVVENRDVDLGTIVLQRGEVTVTGRFVDPQGNGKCLEFSLSDEMKGKYFTVSRKGTNSDGMFCQELMGSRPNGRFTLRAVPANRRIHLTMSQYGICFDTWIGPFTTNTDLGTIVVPAKGEPEGR